MCERIHSFSKKFSRCESKTRNHWQIQSVQYIGLDHLTSNALSHLTLRLCNYQNLHLLPKSSPRFSASQPLTTTFCSGSLPSLLWLEPLFSTRNSKIVPPNLPTHSLSQVGFGLFTGLRLQGPSHSFGVCTHSPLLGFFTLNPVYTQLSLLGFCGPGRRSAWPHRPPPLRSSLLTLGDPCAACTTLKLAVPSSLCTHKWINSLPVSLETRFIRVLHPPFLPELLTCLPSTSFRDWLHLRTMTSLPWLLPLVPVPPSTGLPTGG